jgi:hypothetical protein
MAAEDNKELKVSEKKEVSQPAEQTRAGIFFTPNVDIFETEKEITLLADMPGVKSEDLSIDLRDNTLTLLGDVASCGGRERRGLVLGVCDRQILPPVFPFGGDRSGQNRRQACRRRTAALAAQDREGHPAENYGERRLRTQGPAGCHFACRPGNVPA